MKLKIKLRYAFSIIGAGVCLVLFNLDYDDVTIVISILCLSILFFLSQMLISDYRESNILDDIDDKFPMSNFEVGYNPLTVHSHLLNTTFNSGGSEVGIFDESIVVFGKEFGITERDFSNILTHGGHIIATSKKDPDNEYCCHIFYSSKVFYVKPLNTYGFPFGIYHQQKGVGLIKSNEIILPREIPVEVQIFSYKVVNDIFQLMDRRYRRNAAP